MASNKLLLSIDIDQEALDKALAGFGKKFQTGVKKALAGFDIADALKLQRVEIQFNMAATMRNLDKIKDKINFKIPVGIDLKDAKQQIEDFQAGLKPLKIVADVSQASGNEFSNTLAINPDTINSYKSALQQAKVDLIAVGASTTEVNNRTSEYSRTLASVEKTFEKIQREREATQSLTGKDVLPDLTDGQLKRLKEAEILLEGMRNKLGGANLTQGFLDDSKLPALERFNAELVRLRTNLAEDQAALQKTKDALNLGGITLTEIERKTSSFDRSLISNKINLDQLDVALKEANPDLTKLARNFESTSNAIDTTGRKIREADPAAIIKGSEQQKLDSIFKNFAFSLGLVGYGLENVGRHLTAVAQSMFFLTDRAATLAEPLQRIRNLLSQDDTLDPKKRSFIEGEIRRIADLPGSNLEATAKSFRALNSIGLETIDTIKLVEGLTKATGRAGSGPEAIQEIAKQLREFSASRQLGSKDVKNIVEKGGADVSAIIQQAYGSLDASKIQAGGPTHFIDVLITGLQGVKAPLATTTDEMNRLKNAAIDIGDVFGTIIQPALHATADMLRDNVIPVIKELREKFIGLPEGIQHMISSFVVSIPLVVGGLGILLSTLGTIAIAIGVAAKVGTFWEAGMAKLAQMSGVLVEDFSLLGYATGAVEGGLSGIVGGATRLISFSGPLGIAITLITSYATNFGNLRDSVNEGIDAIYESVKKLITALEGLSSSKYGSMIANNFAILYDVIEGIISVVGSAIGGILTLLADVVDAVTGVISAFNSDSFTGGIRRLFDTIGTFAFRVVQRVGKFAVDIFSAIMKVVGDLMVRAHIISQEDMDARMKDIKAFGESINSNNRVVRDGVLVWEANTTAVDANTEASKTNAKYIREQKDALLELADAAEKARVKLAAHVDADKVKQSELGLDQIQANLAELKTEFTESLKHSFTDETIDSVVADFNTKINAQISKANELVNTLYKDKILGAIQAEKESPLTKAAYQNDVGGKVLPIMLNQIFGATNVADARKALTDFADLLNRLQASGELSGQVAKDAITVHDTLQSAFNIGGEDVFKKSQDFTQLTKRMATEAGIAAGNRVKQIHDLQADQEARKDIATIDEQIVAQKEVIAKANDDVEKFMLTTSAARKIRMEADLEIARLETRIALEKLQRDRLKLDPNDKFALQQNSEQVDAANNSLTSRQKEIRSNAEKGVEKDNADTATKRMVRLRDAAKSAADILSPVTDQILRLIAVSATDGWSQNLSDGFEMIRGKVKALGETMPEISDFLTNFDLSKAGGVNVGKLLKGFVNLNRAPIQKQLDIDLKDARNALQALIITSLGNESEFGAGAISPALASVLGINPNIDTTKSQIVDLIQNLDLPKLIAGQSALLGSEVEGTPEYEALGGLLISAKKTQAELNKISLESSNTFLKKIDDALLEYSKNTAEAQIAENSRKIAQLQKNNAETGLAANMDVIRKLEADNERLNFEKADSNEVFRTRDKIREATTEADKQKIWKESEDTRVRLRIESENKIREITGQTKVSLKPTTLASGIPGAEDSNKTGGAPDATPPPMSLTDRLKSNLGDGAGLDTFGDKMDRINKAFQDTFAGAQKARNGLMDFFNYVGSGGLLLDVFTEAMMGTADSIDTVSALIGTVAVAAFDAFGKALVEVLTNGGGFLATLGKFLGQALISIGTMLISVGTAALAAGLLSKFFPFLMPILNPSGIGEGAAVAAIGVGAALVATGALLGGGKGASSAASTSKTNNTNAATGASGQPAAAYDPKKDPKTMFQQAMAARVYIDIRHDDGIIVQKVIKAVNSNGRLANLIGNRKLEFGY